MSTHLQALKSHFQSKALYPSTRWLTTLLSTQRDSTPLPALQRTALFRFLATDITTSASPPPASAFPSDILAGNPVASRILQGPILCQVLDVQDIGTSKWSQLESIEARDRGEMTRGREVIRVVEPENEAGSTAASNSRSTASKGPFKLLLQDAKGARIFALDLNGIEGVNADMSIGAKILLRGIEVRRGMIMLEGKSVQVLGGKIEGLDKSWKEGRKEKLRSELPARGQAET